jgi:hypothetical protein
MTAIDPTPHGAEVQHELPEPKYPEPQPGKESDEPVRGQPSAGDAEPEIGHRPDLPRHPAMTAADVEDEEADPVVDEGPGIDGGIKGLRKQRG